VAVGRLSEADRTPAEVAKVLEDMKAFGAPEPVIAAARARLMPPRAATVLPIHPDNVTAVKLFQALRTQWRLVPLSTMDRAEIRQVGLDYAAIEVTARLARLELEENDFARIQIMEAAALTAFSELRR
jgi:hypothetical protein